ncbi:MAG: hypothetical protein IMY85_00075 [Chloroflexi bacterium]|nr:hypothetical protein [Chloroflexota bacterium]
MSKKNINMSIKGIAKLIVISVCMIMLFSQVGAQEPVKFAVPQAPIPESPDFATLILRDPWDMTQFTDISQYLNESGQREIIKNPRVENGLFLGTSAGTIAEGNNGNFYPLFPGYETTMLIGKVGHRYPIDANLYHCLYIAMQVNSPADGTSPDRFRVFWFADERFNTAGSEFYGSTVPIRIFEPEADPAPVTNIWKLHKIDLKNPPEGFDTRLATWNDKPFWQGLRIDPTIYADTDFSVDWVRLTNCQANTHTITWTPDSSLSNLWLRPEKTNRYIRIATDVDGQSGSYRLDVQGLAPGKYYVGLSQSLSDCCIVENSQSIVINQTPVADFARPSFYSGEDYATSTGNAWDFRDPADTLKVVGAQASYQNGVLDLVTQSSRNADPKIFLNTPLQIPDSRQYRYLNFRLYTAGPWQNVPDGMILRWIWVQPVDRGDECFRVSHDIPLNVGWQIYSIDLSDPFNGIAEEVAGSCNGLNLHWLESSPLSRFRLDPNENILGIPLHQQLDWVRLTKLEQVTQGTEFTIRIGLNKIPSEIASALFYYTNDLSNPTQHIVKESIKTSNVLNPERIQSSGEEILTSVFQQTVTLPMVMKDYIPLDLPGVANELTYNWDTSAVNPGEYFVCAQVNDTYNEAIYCSEAPVIIIAP